MHKDLTTQFYNTVEKLKKTLDQVSEAIKPYYVSLESDIFDEIEGIRSYSQEIIVYYTQDLEYLEKEKDFEQYEIIAKEGIEEFVQRINRLEELEPELEQELNDLIYGSYEKQVREEYYSNKL